jgi:virginiamycin B lyase
LEERCLPSLGITEFAGFAADSSPTGITLGPDNNLWFTEYSANKIARLNPTTGTITEFDIPTANSFPEAITTGPDGNLWFTENAADKIARITPAGIITAADEFAIPTPASGPWGITSGTRNDLWFTEQNANKIGHITTAGVISAGDEFPIPTANSFPHGITALAGNFGNTIVWFTESETSKIGAFSTDFGLNTIHEFPTPTVLSGPEDITAGPDGNLWFTETVSNQIARITPAGVITRSDEFPILTPHGNPEHITVGPDGNLWFPEDSIDGDTIVAITTDGVIIADLRLPTITSGPLGITMGPHSSVAFTEVARDKIGVVRDVLDSTHAFVQGLYHDALGRTAMPAELNFWGSVLVQSGSAAVVNGIERSPEGRTHLVKGWYLQYLGRPAENGEEQGFVQALNGGATEEDVISVILGSPEYFRHAPLLAMMGGGPSNDQTYIKALYLQLLNRPARGSEVNAWSSAVAALGRGRVAQMILTSVEHRSIVVSGYYTLLLHRDVAAPAEVAAWSRSPMDLGGIRLAFESTLEFYVNG